MAAASEATKNSMGWGRPSSDMNARDWVRMILGLIIGGARRPEVAVAVEETEIFVRKPVESVEGINELTGIGNLLISLLASEFNINKIDLELLVSLHADQEGRTAAGGYDFIGIVLRLEDKCERTLELLENGFDKLGERDTFVWLRIVDIFRKDGNGLRVGLALKLVTAVLEDEAEGGGIGDNTVVHDHEIAGGI